MYVLPLLNRDPTNSRYTSQVIRKLQELRDKAEIDKATYQRLYPTGGIVLRFYPRSIKQTFHSIFPIVHSEERYPYIRDCQAVGLYVVSTCGLGSTLLEEQLRAC